MRSLFSNFFVTESFKFLIKLRRNEREAILRLLRSKLDQSNVVTFSSFQMQQPNNFGLIRLLN